MKAPMKPPVGWYLLRALSWSRQLEAGKTIRKIAEEYGVMPKTVKLVIESLGLVKEKKP